MRRSVRGIGLAGQMHGATLPGADDRPLHPAILWNDGRSAGECDALEAACPDLHAVAGNLAMPGLTPPKLLWVKAHEPELFAQVATVLLAKNYVRLAMTGDKASDVSDSAGTQWLDVARRRWNGSILAACDLEAQMPRLFEGTQATGRLRAAIAESWGMPAVPVAAGGGDNAASCCLPAPRVGRRALMPFRLNIVRQTAVSIGFTPVFTAAREERRPRGTRP